MASRSSNGVVFEDFFPTMVQRLGAEGFMKELCNGFRLLMDEKKGVITFESLKRNSALLGLHGMSDEELRCMLREGDLDGDGCLSEMEFSTLMVRLSPDLMQTSRELMEEALLISFHGREIGSRRVHEGAVQRVSVVKGWRERRDHIRELEEKLCIVGVAWDDEELRCMLREGDLDGDGSLNEMGFCTLMFRLSPALMETSKDFLEEALAFDF
ncbi:hypothetical protein TB1_036253 [Malus domestica]